MAQAPAPAQTSLVGTVLSRRFRLTRELGRGGMGAVYAADRVGEPGEAVAIKVLHAHFVCDELVMTRFMDESKTSMRLVHPNILRIHECLADEGGSPYLVMDLLEGVPLSAYTRDGGRVALRQAVPILQAMLAGLDAAHAAGVVHRDLKPGNVFLARTNGVLTVKLLDFGIAKVMDAAGGMGTKTQAGALLGTPAYMSPEQVKSAKDVDARTDLWSVGVMFYEMLSGRAAFAAPTDYARLAAVLSAQPPPIAAVDPELASVAPFLERALEKDRDRRFQTAREMADALAALVPTSTSVPPASDTLEVPTLEEPSQRQVAKTSGGRPGVEPSAWSLVTDKIAPLGDVETPLPSKREARVSREVLSAAVASSGHGSTLASPNRAPSTAPPPPSPIAVIVVPDQPAPPVRSRAPERASTVPPPRPLPPGMATPMVAMLVTVALALGFSLGVVFARFH